MKRVAIAIIAILVAIGLTGCVEPTVNVDELKSECSIIDDQLGDIYWLLDDARMQADDIWESTTTAWAILSGQEPYDEELHMAAVEDLEDGWKVYDELFETFADIEDRIDSANDSLECILEDAER